MHDRPPFWPIDDDGEDDRSNPHRPNINGLPHIRSGTSEVVYPCPECQSLRIETRNYGRRVGSAIGTAAGATSAFAMTLSGGELGAAVGLIAGPIGSACGGIAGAIIAGLVGGAAGCATGAVFGKALDNNIFDNYRCRACGHTFGEPPF